MNASTANLTIVVPTWTEPTAMDVEPPDKLIELAVHLGRRREDVPPAAQKSR